VAQRTWVAGAARWTQVAEGVLAMLAVAVAVARMPAGAAARPQAVAAVVVAIREAPAGQGPGWSRS